MRYSLTREHNQTYADPRIHRHRAGERLPRTKGRIADGDGGYFRLGDTGRSRSDRRRCSLPDRYTYRHHNHEVRSPDSRDYVRFEQQEYRIGQIYREVETLESHG